MGGPAPLVHAYRLVYPPHASAPEQLWEWPQPWMDHLLWHARTFGRRVEHRDFVIWDTLDHENTRLWETTYAPHPLSALWPTWRGWREEQRALLVTMREVYEAHHGRSGRPCLL